MAITAGNHTPGSQDLFAISTTGRLYHRWCDQATGVWTPWQDLTAPDHPTALACSSLNSNHQAVFVVANGQVLHASWWRGKGWSNWAHMPSLPTGAASQIVAGHRHEGRQDLFAINTTGQLYHCWQNGPTSSWSSWEQLPVPARSTRISCSSLGPNHQELFVLANHQVLQSWWWSDKGWSDWVPMPSLPEGTPIAITAGNHTPDYEDVFALSSTGWLYNRWYDGPASVWSPWEELTC